MRSKSEGISLLRTTSILSLTFLPRKSNVLNDLGEPTIARRSYSSAAVPERLTALVAGREPSPPSESRLPRLALGVKRESETDGPRLYSLPTGVDVLSVGALLRER